MIARRLLFALLALPATVTPAAAEGLYIYWGDGSVSYLRPESVLALLLTGFLVAAAIAGIIAACEQENTTTMVTPYEVTAPPTAEGYHQEADRIKAMARKIDAEAQLAESYINAMRTRALLEELPEILEHDQAMRRR